MINELPKAIFFDWDGTLVDSFSFIYAAHNHARQKLEMPAFTKEDFAPYFGKPREELYRAIYGENGETARHHFEDYVTQRHLTELTPMTNAQDLLETINDLGILAGVVSNKKSELIHQEISGFGWDQYFVSILGAGDSRHDKPAAEPLLNAANKAGITKIASHIWYVGDTDTDLECARNANCSSVFVTNGQENKVWEEEYKPLLVVKNCQALKELLLQCAEK